MSYNKIIYLGSHCNQACKYCDRNYITDVIGDQSLNKKDIPKLVEFLLEQCKDDADPTIGFHGGEPFLYPKYMGEIIEQLPSNYKISILTNGTLLNRNREFLEKHASRLYLSISYDFFDNKLYRGYDLNLVRTLDLLRDCKVFVNQIQWVIPMDISKATLSLSILDEINKIYTEYNIGMITLIPLRHIRGETNFRVLVDDVLYQPFMKRLLQFVQLAYVLDIKLTIDGQEGSINKAYFNNHKQIILSPDGYIYPEFDFLDYKMEEARIGNWKEGILDRATNKDLTMTLESCHSCPQFGNCGLKYLYKAFDKKPVGNCVTFYKLLEAIREHYTRLSKYDNLYEVVV